MLPCFFPLEPVGDGRSGCRRREVERLPFAILHPRLKLECFAAIALASVVSDFDRTATDCLCLELLNYSFGPFCAGEINETVGWVSAGERIDGNV